MSSYACTSTARGISQTREPIVKETEKDNKSAFFGKRGWHANVHVGSFQCLRVRCSFRGKHTLPVLWGEDVCCQLVAACIVAAYSAALVGPCLQVVVTQHAQDTRIDPAHVDQN